MSLPHGILTWLINRDYEVDVSKNGGNPQIIHFNRGFHYKPSILEVFPYFWKHPNRDYEVLTNLHDVFQVPFPRFLLNWVDEAPTGELMGFSDSGLPSNGGL